MCLNRIDKITTIPSHPRGKWRVAYKVFQVRGNKHRVYLTPVQGARISYKMADDKPPYSYTANSVVGIKADTGRVYQAGFHCFRTQKVARKYLDYLKRSRVHRRKRLAVVKVRVAGDIHDGTQYVGMKPVNKDGSMTCDYRLALSAQHMRLEKELEVL